jgi:hypothetical protein
MKRPLPPDVFLLSAFVYAAGVAIVCLIATMARADALDDYQRDQYRQDRELQRRHDEYEARAEEGRRQFERMEQEQFRQEQRARDRREDASRGRYGRF